MKGHTESQYKLANVYIKYGNEIGIPVNVNDVSDLLRMAANKGHLEAIIMLQNYDNAN